MDPWIGDPLEVEYSEVFTAHFTDFGDICKIERIRGSPEMRRESSAKVSGIFGVPSEIKMENSRKLSFCKHFPGSLSFQKISTSRKWISSKANGKLGGFEDKKWQAFTKFSSASRLLGVTRHS